jgi:hypothetical protein
MLLFRQVLILLAVICLVASPGVVLHAQTQGPLKIKKPPPRRVPTREEPEREDRSRRSRAEEIWESEESRGDDERPRLERKGSTGEQERAEPSVVQPTDSGACPEGYIAVKTTEERPRLVRSGGTAAAPEREESEIVECYFSETIVDEDGAVVERRGLERGTSGDPLIEEVRQNVFKFTEKLPDFICDQITDRQYSQTNPPKWKRRDRIEAEVVYLDGKEEYQNLRRDGKRIRGSPQASGAWSTGEFGTLKLDVFHPDSHAKFEFDRTSEVAGIETAVYRFTVKQENSHWRIDFDDYEYYPGYEGSVWIDPEVKRVLRIEMVAVGLPDDYPLDSIETAVDYGPVEIGGRGYYLTQHSQNLACRRYTRNCTKNDLAFRNYRKFATESTIMTTDSSVTFGEGESEGPQLAEPPQIEEAKPEGNQEPRE